MGFRPHLFCTHSPGAILASSADRLTTALADRYRIERELGAGGMATVYLAYDLRHERRVALKVLRPELAAVIGAERFLAEIRTTANLQHPHILPLHDSGEAGGVVFYVMPFVEGESLRDRLSREKQLPIEDAVRITREVAAALDYAHRHGVIHRDIKPENILLHDGSALVADFGIALAVSSAGGGTRMTETGMSLGTPHYMSPEQAMGERELSPRSDVYALGCVLYEMLVGEPPFTGPTAQAIVAKVITEKPPLATTARESVPRHVARAIQKALAKLPADRFGSAAELAEALRRPGTIEFEADPADEPPGGGRPRPSKAVVAGLGLVALVATVAALWGWLRSQPSRPVTATYVKFATKEAPHPGLISAGLSPDGSLLAYVGPSEGGSNRLWVKPRHELHATPLAGTEGAWGPFFSPDGKSIAFFANGKLKKISVAGGGVVSIADAPAAYQWGNWVNAHQIVLGGSGFSLVLVEDAGGIPEVLVGGSLVPGRGAVGVVPLPDNRGFLFAACGVNCSPSDVWVFDLKSRKAQQVIPNALVFAYLPTGHLLYMSGSNGVVLAAPFDLRSLRLAGPGVPVIEGVPSFANLSAAADGTILYQEGNTQEGGRPIWVTRDGTEAPIDSTWNPQVNSLAISPDGKRLAVGIVNGSEENIWVKDLDRGPLSKLTFNGQLLARVSWTPDGRSIVYLGSGTLFRKRADGTGEAIELAKSATHHWSEGAYSPDGKWLVLRTLDSGSVRDLYVVATSEDTTPRPLLVTPIDEFSPAVSPDGHWLVHTAQEGGSGTEVFVRPFPNAGSGKWQISTSGGIEPLWAHNGRELFYINGANELVAAQVATSPSFTVLSQKVLFNVGLFSRDVTHRMYAVSPDDKRFAMIRLTGTGSGDLVMVENWFAVLKAKLKQ